MARSARELSGGPGGSDACGVRGYAIVTTGDGEVVHDAAMLAVGDNVALAFARGGAGAKITRRD